MKEIISIQKVSHYDSFNLCNLFYIVSVAVSQVDLRYAVGIKMNENIIIDIARDTLWLIIKVSAPMLLTSLVVGLVVSVLQTVTSIQEQTLTFVPKLIAVFLVIMLFGSWIMTEVRDFTVNLITNIGYYINAV